MRLFKLGLCTFVAAVSLYGCSGSGTSGNGSGSDSNGLTLNVDQMSPVPLVNGNPQSFYMYATNYGTTQLSNLNWSASLQVSSSAAIKDNTLSNAKAKLSSFIHHSNVKPKDTTNPITIVDASECTTIAAGGTCRVALQATAPGVVTLSAKSGDKDVVLEGGGGLIQADNYPSSYSGNLADALSLSPISTVSYAGSGGSYNFYIVNNGALPVALTSSSVGSLPANTRLVLGNCPNPLASGQACQARLVFTNPTGSTTQELNIPLTLGGDVVNLDNSTTPLPTQNGDQTLTATAQTVGIIQRIASQSLVVDASFGTPAPVSGSGLISNSGTGPLTITSIASGSSLITISNDNCSGKTLGQGETCAYTPTLDVASITNSGSELVNIAYTNANGGSAQTTTSAINWTYIPTLPAAAPSINLTANPSNLNQSTKVATVTVTNNGNVALSNLTAPTLSPNNTKASVTGTTCNGSLAVNASCSYSVTYAPSAPSQTTTVTLSGISASYPDNRGGTGSTSFTNSTAINLSSIFAGSLASSGGLELSDTVSNGTVTFTNNGNSTATLSTIAMTSTSSSNLALNPSASTCVGGQVLNPNASCVVGVKLNSTAASGSGNGTVVITYDNHNGVANASSSNTDISWLIGNAASLNVNFANNNLRTVVSLESSTTVTLTNDGKDDLTNIVLPSLNPATRLNFTAGTSNGCTLNTVSGAKTIPSLTIGQSCTLVLTYAPTTANATSSTTLGSFSASYNGSTYTSSPYSITLTALTPSAISANPSSVSQIANWANSNPTSSVVLRNNGQTAGRIASITPNNGAVTTSGCIGTDIASGGECTLTVSGNYTASTNAEITVNYSDSTATAKTMTINVIGTYTAKPVITPSLNMTASSLFAQNISLLTSQTSTPYLVTLTNNSTASNNSGNTSLSIPYASLLPANDTATYSINVTGISDRPCSLPSSGNSMSLAGGATCHYNLVINSGSNVEASATKNLVTSYNYNVYADNSATPTLSGSNGQTNSFSLTTTQRLAQLSARVATGQTNSLNAIEQGITPSPTLGLVITNMGNRAVNGSITASLPSGISGDFASCDNLAASESCSAVLTMPTTTIISGNLNTVDLDYNNGAGAVTADLPSINYSVVAPGAPSITMVETVTGCASGNGTSSICYNNPNTKGGSASGMKAVLTFTNAPPAPAPVKDGIASSSASNSATVAATSLTLPSSSQAVFTAQGYTESSSTCTNGVAANGGTCTITYSMPAANSGEVQPNITAPSFAFDYNYTTAQGQTKTDSSTSNLQIQISVVNPQLAIAAIESIPQGESKPVTLTWSNLYQEAVPAVNVRATASDGTTPVPGLTPNPATAATCGTKSGAGATCTSAIYSTGSTPIAADYKVTATGATGTSSTSSIATFGVVTPTPTEFMIFFAGNNSIGWSGNLYEQGRSNSVSPTPEAKALITNGIDGADAICTYEAGKSNWHPTLPAGKHWKAMIVDGVYRNACFTPDCSGRPADEHVDWVLKSDTIYTSEDRNSTRKTSLNAIFENANPGVYLYMLPKFDFPSAFSGSYIFPWTGLNSDWTADQANTCWDITVLPTPRFWDTSTETTFGKYGLQNSASTVTGSAQWSSQFSPEPSWLINDFRSCETGNLRTSGTGFSYKMTHGLTCVQQD